MLALETIWYYLHEQHALLTRLGQDEVGEGSEGDIGLCDGPPIGEIGDGCINEDRKELVDDVQM